jgi:hypothetical protein
LDVPVSDYTPDVDSVAGFIRARTKTAGGAEAGTFNPAASPQQDMTRPTAEQVTTEIDNALGRVSGVIGPDIDAAYFEDAKRVTALLAAMLVELGYWPEQVNTGRSTYPQLKDLYDEWWEDLLTALGISTDTGGGAVPAGAGYPSYGGFPTTAIGMEFPW